MGILIDNVYNNKFICVNLRHLRIIHVICGFIMITLPSFKESFAALVAAPTVSSIDPRHDQGNLPAVELLAAWFADLGFRIETMPVGGRPGKVNLVASLGEGAGGLVLSGHTDTVPYDEPAWHQDPFRLTE